MNPQTGIVGSYERRDAILDADWRLIAERGYHQVRSQEIVRMCSTAPAPVPSVTTSLLRRTFFAKRCTAVSRSRFERQSVQLREIDGARQRLLALIEVQVPGPGQVRREWSVWLQLWAEANLREELRSIHNAFYAR